MTTDAAARKRALTEHGSTLLVEAAAGTGKTSLLAGRLVLLLASGVAPGAIVAITFTEFAAAELASRVRHYASGLLAGCMPPGMEAVLPQGLTAEQQGHLHTAYGRLDELETATIHGFCQTMLSAHAVEAGVDPGAQVIDAEAAEVFLWTVFEEWFRDRMSAVPQSGEAIATLAREDPARVTKMLWELANFRLSHRSARTEHVDWTLRPDIELRSAVDGFRRWQSAVEPEAQTLAVLEQLEDLASFYDERLGGSPSFGELWALGNPPRVAAMRKDSFELLPLKTKGSWQKLVGRDAAEARFAEAVSHFQACDEALRAVLGQVATALVETLSDELDGLLQAYSTRKRSAAVLDFEDLLEQARGMLRDHEPVRLALGRRYPYIAVDEFQDTDRVQCEILFRLAALAPAARWQDCSLRPGALFMVGDPKQAIYRFRGAAVETYQDARAAVLRSQPDALVHITANFRSRPEILEHVNQCFRSPLARHGYADLSATVEDGPADVPCLAKLAVRVPPRALVTEIREAEAEAVADLCVRLLGSYRVRARVGELRDLLPGDIALLVPASSDLWIYERELEKRGLAIASQAGKGFYRRQETQDMLALTRALADPGDTLAFGALMRGPLVGMTDATLLDITAALPVVAGRAARFDIRTRPELVAEPVARQVLMALQRLLRRRWTATPHQLLSEAVDLLCIRAKLIQREPLRAAGTLANVDAFLELARSYSVRGLAAFAADVDTDWRTKKQLKEGLADLGADAIALVTMHGAKGLEWPVVIPVNCVSRFRHRDPFVHRASNDTVHWLLGDIAPPGLSAACEEERAGLQREREQLWYVACTRARDLLVLPEIPDASPDSWARVLDLAVPGLIEVQASVPAGWAPQVASPGRNNQTAATFLAEQSAIQAAARPLDWLRPSDADADRLGEPDAAWEADVPQATHGRIVGAGRFRGLILHKLLEEIILGELPPQKMDLETRADVLLPQLMSMADPSEVAPDPTELAATVVGVTELPELAGMWPYLVPETAVLGTILDGDIEHPLSGRADAIAVDGDFAGVVVDWKSDVAPSPEQQREHTRQLQLYLAVTGGTRGMLVYLTSKTVRWVEPATASNHALDHEMQP